jgi:predicted Holliday junction resolvase-like endonuclease
MKIKSTVEFIRQVIKIRYLPNKFDAIMNTLQKSDMLKIKDKTVRKMTNCREAKMKMLNLIKKTANHAKLDTLKTLLF